MTLQRDLVWQNLELLERSSISYQIARYALGLNYKLLPQDVVHQAKRCLLDALGCAIGAYDAPGRPICEAVVQELGGPEEATVFGSGLRVSATNATVVNCFLVRFLDYNDNGGGGHNSDAIPSILAISEREKANGRDLLTSLVMSYELGERVIESITIMRDIDSTRKIGWDNSIRGGLNVPPALGRLMGLNEYQIANAIGICASYSFPLGIFNTDFEEFNMAKNIRFGLTSCNAILSCMLAKRGFTGPVRIVEGESGFNEVICQGKMDLRSLVDFSDWRILNTRFKSVAASGSAAGSALATLALVKEHDLKPEDIAAVRIKTTLSAYNHTTYPAKKYPRNAESADHSAFYVNAIAIKERAVGPQSYDPEKFTDPVVLDLIERIKVETDPDMAKDRGGNYGHRGMSEITTRDGCQFQKRIDVPHGMGDDPLTDRELENKFREMALKYMNESQIQKIFKTVWNVEKLDDMSKLARLMILQS